MEMERINENTIRVLIGNDDLAARGITFLDLLGNHKQIESFFYSILEEVDVEEQFEETDAVTFQVLPNRDGLELFISKNLNNESLDFTDMASNLSSIDDVQQGKSEMPMDEKESGLTNQSTTDNQLDVVFELSNFENLIQLSKEIYLQNAVTNLYKFNDKYYLEVVFFTDEPGENEMETDISRLLEYGKETAVTSEVLGEYGKLLMEQTALELTRYYFK